MTNSASKPPNALENWIEEINNHVGELGAGNSVAIAGSPEPSLSSRVAFCGFPAILPLWSARRSTIGLAVDPLLAPQSWRGVVVFEDGEAMTVASDSATLLPQLLVTLFPKDTAATSRLVENWREIGPKAHALHRVLGGAEQALEEVVAVAGDPEKLVKFGYEKDKPQVQQAAHSSIRRVIDRSESFGLYADWIDATLERRWKILEEPSIAMALGDIESSRWLSVPRFLIHKRRSFLRHGCTIWSKGKPESILAWSSPSGQPHQFRANPFCRRWL